MLQATSDALIANSGGGAVAGHKLYAEWLRLDLLQDAVLALDFPAMQLFLAPLNN